MGTDVIALIDIVMEESEKAIIESYNAGYKQGVLAYKPDVEYWKKKVDSLTIELKKQEQKTCRVGISSAGLGFGMGFLGGMGVGFVVRLSY